MLEKTIDLLITVELETQTDNLIVREDLLHFQPESAPAHYRGWLLSRRVPVGVAINGN